MCCFTQPVESVSGTNIFARAAGGGRQYLAYSMTVVSREPLAMVLPLPTPPGSPADAVRFIPLDDYPDLFADLATLFAPRWRGLSAGGGGWRAEPLAVVEVGSFVASFVPTVADFDRLDPRFQMPAGTWDRLPRYQAFGFAVFQLKPGVQAVHPMAFEFPRADPTRLFFPTVHVHDGVVHKTARFDHALYAQAEPGEVVRRPRLSARSRWEPSQQSVAELVDADRTGGLVAGGQVVHRRRMAGRYANADVYL